MRPSKTHERGDRHGHAKNIRRLRVDFRERATGFAVCHRAAQDPPESMIGAGADEQPVEPRRVMITS